MRTLAFYLLVIFSNVLFITCEENYCNSNNIFAKFLGRVITEDGKPIKNSNICVSLKGVIEIEECADAGVGYDDKEFELPDVKCSVTDEKGNFVIESEIPSDTFKEQKYYRYYTSELITASLKVTGNVNVSSWSNKVEKSCTLYFESGWKSLDLLNSKQVKAKSEYVEINMEFVAVGITENSLNEVGNCD